MTRTLNRTTLAALLAATMIGGLSACSAANDGAAYSNTGISIPYYPGF